MDDEAQSIAQCDPFNYPSVSTYLGETNIYAVVALCVGLLLFFSVLFVFIDTVRYVVRYSSLKVKAHTIFVTAVYPVTCWGSLLVIVVPRAQVISEALIQITFTSGLYQLYCLYVGYGGGHKALLNKLENFELSVKTGPCCCWPCFSLVPKFDTTRKALIFLRALILQLPIVQSFIYISLLVVWSENKVLYQSVYSYTQVILVISIILGLWGMFMTVELFGCILEEDFSILQKFRIYRLVLIFSKLQALITKIFVWTNVLPCDPPMTQMTYANLIHNMLLLIEMFFLAILSRNEYKQEIPKTVKKPQFIANIENIGIKPMEDNKRSELGYDNQACDVSI
ncbi:hypothetical protein GWI33_006183 [Rhynchophorus ferrugineus]|uniref:Organic solute transporter alpha-like protein n=1 Tax=Rhynchophorus ferrugineus TaxID=354439 RepID=A0A834MD77_RHYFE|nr:hypothetical protein GWI33_006183 [Rhynchophorus ferrugineus]